MTKEIIQFLKRMKACVSYGDYDSIKQLSAMELEKWKEVQEQEAKEDEKRRREIQKIKQEPFENWEKEELIHFIKKYIGYFENNLETIDY